MLAPALAVAGDPTAHTAAAVKAARRVQKIYPTGVGAPKVNNTPATGRFPIEIGQDIEVGGPTGNLPCSYLDTACATVDDNGKAINAPDGWSCLSPEQPLSISILNQDFAFFESLVSSALAGIPFFDSATMACNYNHFKSNPALGSLYDAGTISGLVRNGAMRIPADILSPLSPKYCTVDNFKAFYSKIVNSLHYLQDMQTEHHAVGNLVCNGASVVPNQTFNRIFKLEEAGTCAAFLSDTVIHATGVNPTVACDEEVVDRPQQPGVAIGRSDQTLKMIALCAGLGVPLACMGLERTLRHHCKLPGVSKSIVCSGVGGDHSGALAGNPRYCEGEFFSGGGEDFLTPATNVSTDALRSAMQTWAAICKQPDDPCDPVQCDTWCRHSEGHAGYCLNDVVDLTCTLHSCRCATECGGTDQPCCPGAAGAGGTCNDSTNLCAAATGTCIAADSAPICTPVPNPPGTPGTQGTSIGDPHLRTFDGLRYNIQAVGELTLALDADGSEVQVRTQRWGNRNVAINIGVAARIGSDIVAFYSGGTVRINHVIKQVASGATALASGGTLHRLGALYTITWPDGAQLQVDLSREYIAIAMSLPDNHRGHMIGLLGNFDGSATGELATRAGEVMTDPVSFAAFYGIYAESWRITQAASLFDYAAGETTETFTDRSFPFGVVTVADIPEPDRDITAQLCKAAGVSADWIDDCVIDVAISGDSGFASQLAHAAPAAAATTVLPAGPGGNLPGLFPTGVDDAGVALPSGAHDPHYQILNPAQEAIVINPGFTTWVRNTPSYHWVWQAANMGPTNVTRTFRITFSLDGVDPTTASISGTWATDNTGSIALNGQPLGLTSQQFVALTSFTIPAGTSAFKPGTNTLDFTVVDTGGVAGFLVASLQGTAMAFAH
jgi:hypothetical protein